MTEEIHICVAESAGDLATALRIRRQVFTDEQGIPAEKDDDGLDDGAIHVLARRGSVPLATGRVIVSPDRSANLSRIAVLPHYRGQGFGRRIVTELERLAQAQGACKMTLHPHAHLERFYRTLGYLRVPGDSRVGEHDLITMVKDS